MSSTPANQVGLRPRPPSRMLALAGAEAPAFGLSLRSLRSFSSRTFVAAAPNSRAKPATWLKKICNVARPVPGRACSSKKASIVRAAYSSACSSSSNALASSLNVRARLRKFANAAGSSGGPSSMSLSTAVLMFSTPRFGGSSSESAAESASESELEDDEALSALAVFLAGMSEATAPEAAGLCLELHSSAGNEKGSSGAASRRRPRARAMLGRALSKREKGDSSRSKVLVMRGSSV
mmetsp:Transcript_657/g.1076  ORF Transcript_657/g.1076 Transcript_657/m.1076 type:complete len:237 (+) Transcript_657:28-738(+)